MMNHVFSLSSSVLTTLFRFFTFASEYKIFVSSANNTNLRIFDTLHISLMYKMNNLGPSTEGLDWTTLEISAPRCALMCYPSSNITYCIACLLCIGVILLNKFNSIQFSYLWWCHLTD